jgi:hypothetical protein
MANPVPLFPKPVVPTTFIQSTKLQSAVDAAAAARSNSSAGIFPCPISIFDLGAGELGAGASSLPYGGYLDDEQDYIASEAKVGIMYSAYVFRDMARRFNAANSPNSQAELFKQLRDTMDKSIEASVPRVLSGSVPSSHRLPSYEQVLTAKKVGGNLVVDFRTEFVRSLDAMIIPSHNDAAMRCVHGLGFSYLNGALAAGNFFDDSTGLGVWVGGDFQMGKVWAPVRIKTVNDGSSSVASTSEKMAELMASIATGIVLDKASCDDMRDRLGSAANPDPERWPDGDQSWLTRDPEPVGLAPKSVTHDKIGVGPLNAGPLVYSEVCVLQGVGTRTYVVAWQNLSRGVFDFKDIVAVLKDAITAYEASGRRSDFKTQGDHIVTDEGDPAISEAIDTRSESQSAADAGDDSETG